MDQICPIKTHGLRHARASTAHPTSYARESMADILDQSEVDALLNAVSAGAVATVDASEAGSRDTPLEVGDYDFKRPERVSKDQMRALQSIHESFARNF